MESKLKQVDPDKIVSPEAYVAIPALESLSYSMDSVELRNLYANLLANAMNKDVKEKVHPAFIEIIRQLTPNEAKLLEIIFKAKIAPVLDLELDNESGTLLQQYNFTWITEFEYEEIAIAINNFERIGLIEIPFIENYVDDKLYECVRVTQTYKNHKEYLEKLNKGRVEENKKIIKKTALGVSFFNVCVSDN
ncbi:protein of unknown function [Succinivibrio dextrinosolvens DSM 3072]|uniref:DUF4393 domain-containing protein n=1 Tax=Succinivibrio dextrinosolvens DSM 3072 TaxID=1123324 RepID=A0A1T4VBV9_9GAMM|nr:DUF4393 domain-containing protein [Succinivibrio dextrinosolvens]SKA62407.1 protein of unknown function [Succinivibrio dextrinosolvens DSM 3072]